VNNQIIQTNINNNIVDIDLKKKPKGLYNEMKKNLESVAPSFLARRRKLVKNQSIIHFTFDYLFFNLIK